MERIFSQFNMFNNYQNNFVINKNKGYDVILNQKDIKEPPAQSKRNNLYEINTSAKLMNKIQNKQNLTQAEIDVIENEGDGNCYFRVLSQFFNLYEDFHIYFRKRLALYIESKKQQDESAYPYIYKSENVILTYKEYYEELCKTGTFAGEYEIVNSAILFNINIIIYSCNNYSPYNNNNIFQFETIKSPQNNFNPFIPILLIGWCNQNHYIYLSYKKKDNSDNQDNKIKFKTNSKNIGNNNPNTEIKSEEKIDKQFKNSDESYIENNKESPNKRDNNKLILENNKYKDYLSNFVKNNYSVYPKVNGTKNGETKLEDIFNYLVSKKNQNKIIWPKYINDAIAHNDNIKNNKISVIKDKNKANERRKKGWNIPTFGIWY